ncbi:hypothetical protein MRB53_038064 [Persea americana]|nr:hypothetical protein MRB53_038064 [Persea americana]
MLGRDKSTSRGGRSHGRIQQNDLCDERRQIALHVDKIGFVKGRDACLEHFRTDEFTDLRRCLGRHGHRTARVLSLQPCEHGDHAAKDFANRCTTPRIAHAESMCAEQDQWLQDGSVGEDHSRESGLRYVLRGRCGTASIGADPIEFEEKRHEADHAECELAKHTFSRISSPSSSSSCLFCSAAARIDSIPH